MRSKDLYMLPKLIDGQDVFLQSGEIIRRAIIIPVNKHVYVSNLAPKKKNKVIWWRTFEKPDHPGQRLFSHIPEDHLKFYKEDKKKI